MSYFDEDALSNGVDKDANDDSADVEVLVMLKVESGVYENEEIMTVPTWLSVSEFIERTAIVFRETLDERRAYFLTLLKYRAKFNKFITVKLTEENFLEDGAQFELSSSVSCDTKVSNLVHRVSWAPLMSTSTDHRVDFPRTSSEYGGLPYEDDRMSVSPPEANLYTSLSCVQGTDLPEAVDRYRVARAVPCIPSLFSRIISTKPLPMPSNASFKSNEDSIGAPPAGSFFNNAKPKQNYIHQNNRRQPYRGRGKHLYNQGRNRFRTPSPPPRSRLRAWDRSSSRERGHRQSPRHRRSSPRFTRNSPSYSSPSSRSRSYSASSKSRSTSRSKSPSEENDGIKAKNK